MAMEPSLGLAPAAGTGATVPIGLRDWMRTTSDSSCAYVERAVGLAWLLTRQVCKIIEIESTAALRVEDHVAAENVIVYLGVPSSAADVPSVVGVEFRCVASGDGPPSSESSPHPPRAIGAALGELLLEVFTRGQSRSYDARGGDVSSISSSSYSQDPLAQAQADAPTPAGKRHATMPVSNFARAAANNVLVSLGMPFSICQLVCGLMDTRAETPQEIIMDVTSVAEALWDLMQMKTRPQKFLYDRTCPQRALDDTCLFSNTDAHLIGRERETSALMSAKNNISSHVRMEGNSYESITSKQDSNFLCEAIFLSGYAGNGKSSILNSVIHACNEDQWFVLGCKFDKQAAPQILAKAFNNFFGKWGTAGSCGNPSMMQSFNNVCRRIFETMDSGGLGQLCDLVPNFARALSFKICSPSSQDDISSMDKVGSAKKRRKNMFNVLLNSLCSVGLPVLFALDDLQWSESSVLEDVTDFVVNDIGCASGVADSSCRRGLLLVGTFRSNEVKEDDDLVERINTMKQLGRANVTTLSVGGLSKIDVTKLVSEKLCLPWRCTRELGDLVHSKTRGNPLFIVQFLKSIIQNKMLSFSVKSRRWTWDCDVVDMQMISKGVAELLITSFSRLSPALMQTVKILSCLGYQVEISTIEALESRIDVPLFNMQSEMPLAVREGILEKAGPLYQFTHDIIQSTIYELIPSNDRTLLHKSIGLNLLKSAAHNYEIFLIAVDQLNIFCKGGNPNPDERSQFANNNATAAKYAIAASSFEQACSYIDMGIRLLEEHHWATQYSLSLDLFEMSASVSCMHGDNTKMSSCLGKILSHTRTFEDKLKAQSLLVKLLASASNFDEARGHCLAILSKLGEVFPQEVSLPVVLNELSSMQVTFRGITRQQIKSLPPMTDRKKLHAMQFLNMLCVYSRISKPMLLPLLSIRMVKLTMEFGFCEDSIVGLATASLPVLYYTDNIQLASHICKVSESFIEESPKKHILRSRLCIESVSTLKFITEPMQSALSLIPELYNSAMLSGDVENAMTCRWVYCGACLYGGALDLSSLSKQFLKCIKEAAKYQQNNALQSAMSSLNLCSYLSGEDIVRFGYKSFDELGEIGERTKNHYLSYHNFVNRLALNFWMRRYKDVIAISEKHSRKHPPSQMKRALNIFRTLYEGVAYLNLARDTKQDRWKILGEKAVKWMYQFESMSKWNFENKSKLLQAELYYLEGNPELAEAAYAASIQSAHDHNFIHEEAMACELYGIFCVENQMVEKGSRHLLAALDKYKQWGAMKKANQLTEEVQLFMDGTFARRPNQEISLVP